MGPTGLVALLAGWFTTEIGRQPWVVYGLMRTADAATPHSVTQLTISLALFVITYFFVFGVGIAYMLRLVRKGPKPSEGDVFESDAKPPTDHKPARPLSAIDDDTRLNPAEARS